MSLDVMIDLETMGTNAMAPIVQIAAVLWETDNGVVQQTFQTHVSLSDELKYGFRPDAGTIMFWMEQSEEARSALVKGQLRAKPTKQMLTDLSLWFFKHKLERSVVWTNGPSFDSTILASHYRKFNEDLPWSFWNDRCFRTLMSELSFNPKNEPRTGVHHNALDDCLHQIKCIQKARNKPYVGI
jgi:hypothetical protein